MTSDFLLLKFIYQHISSLVSFQLKLSKHFTVQQMYARIIGQLDQQREIGQGRRAEREEEQSQRRGEQPCGLVAALAAA